MWAKLFLKVVKTYMVILECVYSRALAMTLLHTTIILCTYVIGSEKTTLVTQNLKMYFYVWLKLQVCSLFFSLFQAHSAFRYVVMGANTRQCLRTQNKIIASKTELPVKS